jgi:hypothetical protein
MDDIIKISFLIFCLFILYHFLTKQRQCKIKAKKVIRQKTYFGVPGKKPPNLPVRWHI